MKKLLCVLLACICLLSLGGCHGSKGLPAFAIPEDFDDSKTYTISFWAKNDTNLTQVAIYEQTIEEFEKIYPNIRVNLRLYTDYGRIYNDVITNISTNTTPNVCITYPDHIATYLTGTNTVIPLDELLTCCTIKNTVSAAARCALTRRPPRRSCRSSSGSAM